MPFKIRTKLMVAFMAIISTILILTGLVVYYNFSASDRATHEVEAIAEEILVVSGLQYSLEHALMPANDYLITGNRKYIDDFDAHSKRVEETLKKADELLGHLEAFGLLHLEKEVKSLKDIKTAWQNIKELSLKILSIPNPIGNKDGAMMMEEMDYRWSGPATELLHKWLKGDVEEYKEAVELAEKARRTSWFIMGSAGILLLILGAGFAAFYSGFFVRPIKKLHNGADAIAGGDFKSRVDVKTGDELERLSNAMNEMAAQLDSFYETLERKVQERTREFKESEERFRQLFNSSSDAVFVHGITPDGKPGDFIEVNDISCDRLGYTRDELLKMSPVSIDDPEMAKQQAGVIKDFITKKNIMFEMVHIAKDGRKIPVEINARFFELNKQPFVLSVARDITERKKAEEALKESEERFRAITNTAGDAIIGLEAPGNIKLWNKKAEEIFGYPADDVMGRDMHDLIVPEKYLEKAREGLKVFFQTGSGPVIGKTVDLTALRKDGTEFPIALSISAMKIEGKWQVTGIIRDITERKKAEEELAKHVDELERYMKATVQREFRIKELRDRVEDLEKRLKG